MESRDVNPAFEPPEKYPEYIWEPEIIMLKPGRKLNFDEWKPEATKRQKVARIPFFDWNDNLQGSEKFLPVKINNFDQVQ